MCFPEAKDELNETDERRASSVKDLRTVMKERAAEGDNLAKLVLERFGDKPDSLLLRFLRARKFDISRSHELMKGSFPESDQLCCTFKSHFHADPSRLRVCESWFRASLSKHATVTEGRASFLLLVFPHITETGRHVFINWKLLDASECPPPPAPPSQSPPLCPNGTESRLR